MDGIQKSPRRRPSWRKIVFVQLALLPAWMLAAELLFRAILWLGGQSYHADEARASITTLFTGLTEAVAVPDLRPKADDPNTESFYEGWHAHPYIGFEDGSQFRLTQGELASLARPRDPQEYSILLLGGSVAMLFEPEGTEALKQKLLEDPRFQGRTIRFLVFARPAFKQPQQLMLAAWLFDLGMRPDAVINLDGFNEAAFAWSNIESGANPAYPDMGIWGHSVSSDPNDRRALDLLLDIRALQTEVTSIANFALDWRLYESSILGRLTLARLGSRVARATRAREAYVESLASHGTRALLHGPAAPGSKAGALDLALRAWLEASRSLQYLCRGRSIFYLHALQPTLFDEGSKPLTQNEIMTAGSNPRFIDGVHALYPRFRAAGPELCALGVNFVDESMAFVDVRETVYFDHCHYKVAGKRILALRLAEDFLRTLPR